MVLTVNALLDAGELPTDEAACARRWPATSAAAPATAAIIDAVLELARR